MSRARRIVIAFCSIAGLLLWVGTALAGGSGAQKAARAAQDKHGGRVLKVERIDDGYRVKLLKDSGKVKVVFVPSSEKNNERAQNYWGEAPQGRLSDFRQQPLRVPR